MTYFTEQVVKVNGSGLAAERASLSFESPLQQIPSIGYKGAGATSLFGAIRGTAQISYIVQTSQEPFYELIKDLRSRHAVHYEPINLQIGAVTGAFYVESVSYTVVQNDLVRADVSLISFETTAESSVDKTIGYVDGDTAYGSLSYASLASTETNSVLDFTYNFRANWQPIYKLGSKRPMQVQLLGAEEQTVLTHLDWTHQSYTGATYTSVTNLNILGTGSYAVTIPLSGGIVKSRALNAQPDDIARTQTTVTKIF